MKTQKGSGSKKGGEIDGRTTSRTAAQRGVGKNLARFSRMWNELTVQQRANWWTRAGNVGSRPRKGRLSYPLDGQKLFNKINWVLALLKREPRSDPPPLPNFLGVRPVEALEITGTGKSIALKLRVKGTPTEEIMVFGSPPQNAGRTYCGDYRFLGLLPAPVEGWSDITRLYVEKYGVPRENSRVFIRTWPQVDGCEDLADMQKADALVPTRGGGVGGARGGGAGAKKVEE